MFIPNSNQVMQVVVDGRAHGQAVLNTYYFRYSGANTGPTGGSSATFLTNFRSSYRLNVLPLMSAAFTVARYWLRSVNDAVLQAPFPGGRWQAVYDVSKLDLIDGLGPDIGAIAIPATGILPTHECMRVRKDPSTRRVGFHNRSYNRYAPMHINELDVDGVDHDRWTFATVNSWNLNINIFHETEIFDQLGGNGWNHAVFSAVYFGRVIKPLGGPLTDAAETIASASARPYVGTQVSRRYSPSGLQRGS